LISVSALLAQGTGGTLTGTVTQDGNPVPGVTVIASSPNLQGTRTSVTNEAGGYNFAGLPPGEYTVKFELSGLQTVTKRQKVGIAQTSRADAEMRVSSMAEAITVTATAPAVAETTEVQTNFTQNEIDSLPIGRTIDAITGLAPGTVAGVNGLSISGSLSYDNVYMVDGVNIQENLRGQTQTLFIEDAIQETTVQTAGISAEFGNFTGGVVNSITKSGGNEFSGSLRDSISNEAWTHQSPEIFALETVDPVKCRDAGAAPPCIRVDQPAKFLDKDNHIYEGTLGGRILRDRLWFFGAARYFNRTFTNNFSNQARIFTRGDKDERWEAKLTGAITAKHSLVASYLNAPRTRTNDCQLGCITDSALDPTNELPLDYMNFFYNGVITNNFLLEAKYADKNFRFEGTGGEDTSLISGTPIRFVAPGWSTVGNEAYFGGSGRHSDIRDSDQLAVKSTYYLGTRSMGNHNIIAGIDRWHETRKSNNFQSPNDFVWFIQSRAPSVDASGNVTMSIVPGSDILLYFPIALQSLGSDLNTNSLYINDKWDFGSKWSFNLGARYDQNRSDDSTGNKIADDSKISPRLGAMYDILGNGRYRINASFGTYVGRLADTVGGSGSAAGSPATIQYFYRGPAINNVSMESAMETAFNWFNSAGGTNLTPDAQSVPGFNQRLTDTLVSPNVQEWTIGGSAQIGNGFIRLDYIDRDWKDFYGVNVNTGIGTVTSAVGNRADLRLVENSDDFERHYEAIEVQAAYRLFNRLNVGGNYTWSELRGNVIGETSGAGPVTEATEAFYPEYIKFAWNNPVGFLTQDQTHKLRAWVSYDLPTVIGNFNASVLQRFDSGTPYSLSGSIDTRANANYYGAGLPGGVANPGYVTPQGGASVTYFFSERGQFRFDDITATDVALNYATNPGWLAGAQIFVQGELLNAFNNEGITSHNTSVLTHVNDASLKRFNPNNGDVPQEGVHWKKGPLFGLPTAAATAAGGGSYQLQRTYRVSLGLRF
jgi:hypothetical protein